MASSRASTVSVASRARPIMRSTWGAAMDPSSQAPAVTGRRRSILPRRTKRRAIVRGIRHMAAIQAVAFLAPSWAQSPDASNCATAQVVKDSSRESSWTRRVTDSASPYSDAPSTTNSSMA